MNFLSEDSTFFLHFPYLTLVFFLLSFTSTYFQFNLTPISIELRSFSPSVSMDISYTIETESNSA